MEISLLTPKCHLVPEDFFRPEACHELLSKVFMLGVEAEVADKEVQQ